MNDPPTGTVTFLFTDIEGSTKLWENYPTQMEADLARHDRILKSTVEEHGGYVFKMVGDACCAAFAHPREALRAALASQRALFDEEWSGPTGLRVRMSLHTGATEERDGDYFGPPVNRVARLLSAAHGGQVLLSGAIHNLVRDHPTLVDEAARFLELGEYRLKDLTHPERIYQIAVPNLPSVFPPLRADKTPEEFDERYRFKNFLGSGGMAKVYVAHDERLDQDVAIKVLHPRYLEDEEFVERFRREAKSAAKLRSHPNIVPVYDWGEKKDGTYYMVMECMPGGALKDRIVREGPLPARTAVELTLQIARALEVAHEEGIVHRDIKPQNILLTKRGEVKVGDFGIARAASASTLTRTGLFMGTPHYVAPEQAEGEPASFRSDLYALGVVLYEMLTKELPYDAETPMGIMMKQLRGQLRSPKEINPNVPERVNTVTMRLLAREPNDRYPNAAALIEELRQVLGSLEDDHEMVVGRFLGGGAGGEDYAVTVTTVRVPDLTGKNVSLASNTLADEGLTLGDQTEVPSETVPEGAIIGQSPEAGAEAEPDTLVSVTVSSGPSTVKIPDLTGLSRSEASSVLTAADLKLGGQNEAPSDMAPEGETTGQYPLAQTKAKRDSSVSITVSSGAQKVAVPDLAGQRLPQARSKLAKASLKLGGKNEAPSDTVTKGKIIKQNPAAETKAKRGSTVSVTVSTGPARTKAKRGSTVSTRPSTVRVPDLAGKSVFLASGTLARRGLKLGDRKEVPSDTKSEGLIIGQTPKAGAEAEPGGLVSVTVSSGKATTVPDVSGKSVEEAGRVLSRVGFALAGSRTKKSRKPAGTVISTQPSAGSKVASGTPVILIVSDESLRRFKGGFTELP